MGFASCECIVLIRFFCDCRAMAEKRFSPMSNNGLHLLCVLGAAAYAVYLRSSNEV